MKSGQKLKGQKPKGRGWSRGHEGAQVTDWFVLHGLLSLLIEPRTINPGMAPHTMDWAISHQSLIKKMPYSRILWRHFLNCGSPLSGNSSSCQVERKRLASMHLLLPPDCWLYKCALTFPKLFYKLFLHSSCVYCVVYVCNGIFDYAMVANSGHQACKQHFYLLSHVASLLNFF